MKSLRKFYRFVDEITSNNSRLYKLEILKKYLVDKNDSDIKDYLYFLYNPYITTGISTKKLKRAVNLDEIPQNLPKKVLDLLHYIIENNTGSYDVLKTINFFKFIFIILDADDFVDNDIDIMCDFLDKIISKNLQLGIDIKSINKIVPGLIPTFEVMLANSYFDKPEYVEGKDFSLTTKIDGGRIIAIKEKENVKFYTRSGQLYEGLVDLEKEMLEKLPSDIVLDGEITLLNPKNLTSKDQYKETMKITRKLGEKHGVKMLVFDFMPVNEFYNQNSIKTYSERQHDLNTIVFGNKELKYFEKLPILYSGSDISKINYYLNQQIQNGEEGIMININDAKYEFKRSNNLLKVKKMKDIDLEIIGFDEGENRNAGKLGALLFEYKGNILKVGSGISDQLREEIWSNKEAYLGLTATIQYFEETTNADGGISLRFPIFIDFRYDK